MRKIKKFKIPIYTYDILRKAKKRNIDLFALGLAEQESAKEYISSIAAALEPSTMFDLLAPEENLPRSFGSETNANSSTLTPIGTGQGPKGRGLAKKDGTAIGLNGGAGTLGVITFGAAFAEKLKAITDPDLFRLAETAALVFAETGLKVVSELINQEAAAEGFDLGTPRHLCACSEPETEDKPAYQSDPETLAAILNRLSADKIGVSLLEGSLSPKYSLIFSIPWLAKKTKKSAAK